MYRGVKFIFGVIFLVTILFCFNLMLNTADNLVIKHGHFETVSKGIGKIVDSNGDIWNWKIEEGNKIILGKNFTFIVDTQGTKDKKDDIILKLNLDK